MKSMKPAGEIRGPIAWMAKNHVAANLLMIFLLIGGGMMSLKVKQEVFPEVDLDMVSISVPYPGASPAEVEQAIVLPIEEGVRGLDGVKRVTATANEGLGSVVVELLLGADGNKLLQDIKNAVDRIVSFPLEAERPLVSLLTNRRKVISLVVYGDQDERVLRLLASRMREELLQEKGITMVELSGVRPLEISIEISQETLRAYGTTMAQIARRVSQSAIELPGGGVKTSGGEVLLRMAERRDLGREFADIPVVSRPDGTEVRLEEIATIIDGFADTDQATYFNGKPAACIEVYRVGDQTPIEVAAIVKKKVAQLRSTLPPGIGIATWRDMSEIYEQRINLLLRNASLGLFLVLLVLGLFLEIRLAFWVTIGIPISFLGALLFLPAMDVSINMISLFAFIVTLGIVVDDAIVVGENIYEFRERGMPFLEAAVKGTRQIAVPVSFSILTNIAAFTPMFFIPGNMGKFFRVIPAIVVSVFIISWVESLFVLPAHLGHLRPKKRHGLGAVLRRIQDRFAGFLQFIIHRIYAPFLRACLRNRILTFATSLAVLITTLGFVLGERIDFTLMPRVESDVVTCNAVLPYGSPVAKAKTLTKRLVRAADEVLDRNGGKKMARGVMAQVGFSFLGGGPRGGTSSRGSHLVNVRVYLVPSDQRAFSAAQFEDQMRSNLGEITGLESLEFTSTAGPGGGAQVDIELNHAEIDVIEQAAVEVAEELDTIPGVIDINKGFTLGKPQLDFKIKPEASSLGLTAADVGRQVRSAFFGAEAIRQQRGRDEVRIYVRLPKAQRYSEFHLENMLIRTSGGGEIPLSEAARIERGRAYTAIKRTEGKRAIHVTANITENATTTAKVIRFFRQKIQPKLLREHPGLHFSFEGRQRERRESMQSLGQGFMLAILAIFAMLAIPFRSYTQPLIIMISIPFGVVGAVIGHLIMGYNLSLISTMGIVALSGVVVNDSLVLVHAVNRYRKEEGDDLFQAVVRGGTRRFRPIVLTSVTTFLGLAPMIFETSMQARFLIPMAISLGFGILFATLIALILVPSLYLLLEDVKGFFPKRDGLEITIQ